MIIVVIALLVLIILAYMIIKSASSVPKETSCDARGGKCVDTIANCDGIPSNFNCPSKSDPVCCMLGK
jgi:hypothetical protein